MVRKIRLRRGYERDLPLLDAGEVAITIDSNKVFYGTGVRNMRLATYSELETILGVNEGDLNDLTGLKEIQEALESIQVYANEIEFTTTKGQIDFTLPSTANPSSGWIEVFVNGLRIPKKSFQITEGRKIKLNISSSTVAAGTKVIVKWPEDTVPALEGHSHTHRKGGPDEILLSELYGFDELDSSVTALERYLTELPMVNTKAALPDTAPTGEIRRVGDSNLYYIRKATGWERLELGKELQGLSSLNVDDQTEVTHTKTKAMSVRIPSDYANLTEAFNDLTRYRPKNGVTFDLVFESGHRPTRGVSLSNGDFSHFQISSEDPTVKVSDKFTGNFLRVSNGAAPVLNTVIDMNNVGETGVRIEGGSRGMALPQAGVVNAGETGLYVRTSTYQAPYSKFNGCHGRNVWITRGANVSIPNSDISNPQGDRVGVYVSRSSILDASEANISGGTAEYANIQVLRSKATLLGATITNATRDAVHAGSGSEIVLRGGDLSGAGRNAIRCTGGATIHLGDSIDLRNAGEDAIYVSSSSRVSGTNIKAGGAGLNGVYVTGNSIANVPGINASNCGGAGLYAIEGGKIVAADSEGARSYLNFNASHGAYAGVGSEVVLRDVKISNNKGSGLYVINGSSVTAHTTTIENSTTYGIYAVASDVTIRTSSSVKNSGRTDWDLVVASGSKIIATGTQTTGSASVSPKWGNTNVSKFNEYEGNLGIIIG